MLLDSNLLLLLLVGTLDRILIRRFKRTSQFTEEEFDSLVTLTSGAGAIITTPHLLTEVSNLANSLRDDLKVDFANIFALAIQRIEERHTPAKVLSQDPLFRFGLADTALRSASAGALILTEDGRLARQLVALGIRAVDLRSAVWLLRQH